MLNRLFTSKDGQVVEVDPLAYGTLLVTYCNQGGGFVQKMPRKTFDSIFTPYQFPDEWKATYFTGDWFQDGNDRLDPIPGYHQNKRWNGWAMPAFDKEMGLRLIAMFPDWKGEYDSSTDSFMFPSEGAGPDIYGAQTIKLEDGTTKAVYAIGAGSWTWEVDDAMEVGDRPASEVLGGPAVRFVVDGHTYPNEEGTLEGVGDKEGDGRYPPFRVFDIDEQQHTAAKWPTIEEAQTEADRLNEELGPDAVATHGPLDVLTDTRELLLTLGTVIRSEDDEGKHSELWTNDGGYIPDYRFKAFDDMHKRAPRLAELACYTTSDDVDLTHAQFLECVVDRINEDLSAGTFVGGKNYSEPKQ